ncbi:hypothetical protein QWY20_17245 [Alkalimonas sp. MEB108]|uniref:Uncharacterized protein n=1 Tax=Alkalimonas cellulosilytica TaxID=3058395 RepID=A0ABU7J9I1_9GAMM|nr:hypothetical protein [Alkalimonas sp. MEB108]MEE2003203.1 hypothetical protein [Alkalimonas sp. MEB108]
MRLNGWQRMFCVFLIPFWAYLAITLYQELSTINTRVQQLDYRLEELKSAPEQQHPPRFNREQTIVELQQHLKQQQVAKNFTIILVVFFAIPVPAIFYFTIAWIAAGFRIKDKETA